MHFPRICYFLLLIGSSIGLKWDWDEDTVMIDTYPELDESLSRSKRQLIFGPPLIPLVHVYASDDLVEVKSGVLQCMTNNGEEGICATFKECYPYHYAHLDDDDEVTPDGAQVSSGEVLTSSSHELANMLRNASGICDKSSSKICCAWMKPATSGALKKPSVGVTRRPPSKGQNQRPKPPAGETSNPSLVRASCGQKQIVGGGAVHKGQVPWMVALMNNGRQFCGGSLIDSLHVLTAAHCVSHMTSRDVQNLRLYMGDHDIYTTRDGPNIVKRASKIFYNRGFSFRNLFNDIAIIRLESSVYSNRANLKVMPICIPSSYSRTSSTDNLIGTVTGWGKLGSRYGQSRNLQSVNVRIWPNWQCQNKYGNKSPAGIQNHMVCAGTRNLDSCRGDSGGPMSIMRNGRQEQIGIVSWGIDCGDPPGYYPGVYTRIDHFLPWINKNRI